MERLIKPIPYVSLYIYLFYYYTTIYIEFQFASLFLNLKHRCAAETKLSLVIPVCSLKYGHQTPASQLQYHVQLDLELDLPVFAARLKIVESVLLSITGCKLGFPVVLQPVKRFCFES